MEGKEVTVAFIVVASFSLYRAILGRPWIHAMRVVAVVNQEIKHKEKAKEVSL